MYIYFCVLNIVSGKQMAHYMKTILWSSVLFLFLSSTRRSKSIQPELESRQLLI